MHIHTRIKYPDGSLFWKGHLAMIPRVGDHLTIDDEPPELLVTRVTWTVYNGTTPYLSVEIKVTEEQ